MRDIDINREMLLNEDYFMRKARKKQMDLRGEVNHEDNGLQKGDEV